MANADIVARRNTLKKGSVVRVVRDPVELHTYYIVDGDEHAVANVTWLDFYGGLAQFSPVTSVQGVEKVGNVDGFFFVRHAHDLRVLDDGQGDQLVHKGWGMYIWDPKDYIARKPATNAGWVLIAKQTDVDWDIGDELKSLFVLKTIYNQRCNAVDNRFKIDEAILKQISSHLTIIENNWDKGDNVHGKAHWHDNKEVLDELEDNFNFLYYKGRPISGNSFVYDHIESGEIVWCDPTKKEAEWTHEVVKNSFEIATLFGQTSLARVGLSLFVMEVDGSVTIYKYNRTSSSGGDGTVKLKTINECVDGFSVSDDSIVIDPENMTVNGYSRFVVDAENVVPGCRDSVDPNASVLADYAVYQALQGTEYADKYYASGYVEVDFDWILQKRDEGADIYVHGLNLESTVETVDPAGSVAGGADFSKETVFDDIPENAVFFSWGVSGGPDVRTVISREAAASALARIQSPRPILGSGNYGYIVPNSLDVIAPRFAQTCVIGNRGLAEYVDLLPEATKWHYQRGCWVPLQNDGEHIVGHLHECVEEWVEESGSYRYYWRDITTAGGESIDVVGSTIDLAYSKDDTLWKQNCIFLSEPEDTSVEGRACKWRETKLVRKFGAAPTSVEDGEVVVTYTTRDKFKETPYLDIVPFTQAEPVYYAAFSTTTAGDKYAPSAAVEATKLTWLRIRKVMGAHRDDLGKIFKIGDTVVLPPHSTYGNIECEVVGINQNAIEENETGLLVVARNVICKKLIDAVEENKVGQSFNDENVTNRETGGTEPAGSNGSPMTVVTMDGMMTRHKVDTLNVISWLNSAENPWEAVPTTDFDVIPSDDDESGYYTRDHSLEAGFLAGFEEADRYMFQIQRYVNTPDHTLAMNTRILLPYGLGVTNMSKKYKQLGKARAPVAWGTLVPGDWPAHLRPGGSRVNFGFKTYAGQEDGTVVENSVTPQTVVGIAPMFFIGGIA